MIRIACPKCKERMVLDDSSRGQLGVCPDCGSRFRIPAAKVPAETNTPPAAVSALPLQPKRVLPVQPIEEADEQPRSRRDDAEMPARRRRRRRRSRSFQEMIEDVNFVVVLAVFAGIALVSVLAAAIWPPLASIPAILGVLIMLAAGIWLLAYVFLENVTWGVMCLIPCIGPFATLIFLVVRFDLAWRPFVANLAGLALCCAGVLLMPPPARPERAPPPPWVQEQMEARRAELKQRQEQQNTLRRPRVVAVPVEPPPQQPAQRPAPVQQPAPVPDRAPVAPAAPPVAAPQPPPVDNNPVPPPIALGTKITVRAEVAGAPPDFQGDFNKQVVQNLEIILRQMGYEPVPEGGLPLVVRASVVSTGKTISVRQLGPPPIPRPGQPPRMGKPGQPPGLNRVQEYPLEQLNASVVLTNLQGTALWQNERQFTAHIIIFHTDNPPREMQQQMWRAFESWTRSAAVAPLKQ